MSNEQKYLLYTIIIFHTIYLFCHSIQYNPQFVSHYKVNINECSFEELCSIPGIGKKKAWNIYMHRVKKGKFDTVNDMLMIKGIGKAFISQISVYVWIEEPSHENTMVIPLK